MEQLIEQLKRLLADLSAYRIKTQYYHWNIEGPDFNQYHEFLNGIYAAANDDVDTVAEHIRALEAYAPGSLRRFMELTSIQDEETIPAALEMINRVYQDNQLILVTIRNAALNAEQLGQRGTLNFLEGLIEAYEKQAWMLRSTLKRA